MRIRPNFGIATLLALVALAALCVEYARRWYRDDRLQHVREVVESLHYGRSQTMIVEDGDIVLYRQPPFYGAIIVDSQNHAPPSLSYRWAWRDDGNGNIFESSPAVHSGSGSDSFAQSQSSSFDLGVGPFLSVRWRGVYKGFGELSEPDNEDVEFCIIRPAPKKLEQVNAASDYLTYIQVEAKRARQPSNARRAGHSWND